MGHDAHFLQRLDRVTREHTELALGLYRDHELVRQLLESSEIPPNAERVALALEDGGLGPHVVVARSGAFVTCLGRGMTTVGTPVLSRAKLDATMLRRADLRERLAAARAYARKGEADGDFLVRIVTRRNTLTREEIRGVSAFAPLLGEHLYVALAKNLREACSVAEAFRRQARGRCLPAAILEAYPQLVWSGVHGVQLFGFAGPESLAWLIRKYQGRFGFSMPTTRMIQRTMVFRGLWAAAQLGDALLEPYMRQLVDEEAVIRQLDAVAALSVIALKTRTLETDVRRFLKRLVATETVDKGRRVVAALGIATLDGAEQGWCDRSLELGRKEFVTLASARLPVGHPLAPQGDECDPDLAHTCALNDVGGLGDGRKGIAALFATLPLVATSPLESFFYPSAVARHVVEPWGQEQVALHMGQLASALAPPTPAKNDAKVGRNEPCPCGSGKKAKRCCSR